jgi:putative phage-type endonuclease
MIDNTIMIDVTDNIIPDDIPYFNDEESLELYQMCIYLMEEFINDYPTIITEQEFDDMFDESIEELMHSHFEFDICYTDDAEDEMNEIIEQAKADFFTHYIQPRSYADTLILENPNFVYIKEQLNVLRNKPQPAQRTKEWYEFRHNLITASNAYKAFESQCMKNQLIYEKCQPLNKSLYIDEDNSLEYGENEIRDVREIKEIKEVKVVNTNTPLHWGQKYEPLSVKIYEEKYNTIIEDFGCIQHDKYLFLGASPDGINIDTNSQRYGRMLEIKNIVNREINGIPKKEYWIQMQLQMEVCGLDECDFLETKFIEYPDYNTYVIDTSDDLYEDDDGIEFQNLCLSKENKMKGQIIHFHTKEGKPFYVYKPLDVIHPDEIAEWQENTVDNYQNNPEFNYTYMKTIYWKLEKLSCVLVCRNRQWFNDNVGGLKDLWDIVEKERISGYGHRAPNRKAKKENTLDLSSNQSTGCLLKFNKENNKDKEKEPIKITVIKQDTTNTIKQYFNIKLNI